MFVCMYLVSTCIINFCQKTVIMRFHNIALALFTHPVMIKGAATKHLLWDYSGPSLVAIKTNIHPTSSRIACVESLTKDEDEHREALFRTECITFELEALILGHPLPKEYAEKRKREVSQRLVPFPLKSMDRLKIGILGKSDSILKSLERYSKEAESWSVRSKAQFSQVYDLDDYGMSSNCLFTIRKGLIEQFSLVILLKTWIEKNIHHQLSQQGVTWAFGFMDKIRMASREEMVNLSDRARLMEVLNSGIDFKNVPPCEEELVESFVAEIDQVIDTCNRLLTVPATKHLSVFTPWFNEHCHLAPSPDVLVTRKEAAGKVLAYAKLRGEKIGEDFRYLAKLMPNLNVNDPQTGELIAEIPAFTMDDVTDALRRIKPLHFSADAEPDIVARELLENASECKNLCVERFANWAVDEMKKGTATEAFILQVRKLFQIH